MSTAAVRVLKFFFWPCVNEAAGTMALSAMDGDFSWRRKLWTSCPRQKLTACTEGGCTVVEKEKLSFVFSVDKPNQFSLTKPEHPL